MSEPTERERPRRWLQILLLQLVLLPAALLVGEFAYRGMLAARGEPYSVWGTHRELGRLASVMGDDLPQDGQELVPREQAGAARSSSVLHPYVGFVPVRMMDNWARDDRMFGPEGRDGRYVVLIVGGSVAGNFRRDAGDRLAGALKGTPLVDGRNVVVLNYAVGGFKAPQQAALLTHLLALGRRPDAVVNIDGFNEVAIGLYNARKGLNPSYPSLQHWGHVGFGQGPDGSFEELRELARSGRDTAHFAIRNRIFHSAVLGTWALGRVQSAWEELVPLGQRYEGEMLELSDPAALGPEYDAEASTEELLADIVSTWASSSRAMDDLCRARGIHYVHVLQPTLHDEGSKPLTESELESATADPYWVEGARIGYPMLRERGAELREEGVPFLDLSLAFRDVTEALYFDPCHFRATGAQRLVKPIVEELRARYE